MADLAQAFDRWYAAERARHRFPDVSRFEEEYLARMTDEQLQREYLDTVRDCFSRNPHHHNARRYLSFIVRELRRRGIRTIPNRFGPIHVREWPE